MSPAVEECRLLWAIVPGFGELSAAKCHGTLPWADVGCRWKSRAAVARCRLPWRNVGCRGRLSRDLAECRLTIRRGTLPWQKSSCLGALSPAVGTCPGSGSTITHEGRRVPGSPAAQRFHGGPRADSRLHRRV